MLTIITPCSRPDNLGMLSKSIKFDKIDKWIIVYDTTKDRTYKKSFEGNSKIIEVECNDAGDYGNQQRNYGMSLVDDGFIYFLDDDNIVHPADLYQADAVFICDILKQNPQCHKFLNAFACYYNFIE